MIRRIACAALLAILGAAGCGPPSHVLDRVPAPIRPAWLAAQPEFASLAPSAVAALDRAQDRYGAAILAARTQRLAALANAVRDIDARSADPEALRRWIAEARAARNELDAADASFVGELAADGAVSPELAQRWGLRRRVERELDLLAQAGFGSPPDVAEAIAALPPPGWDVSRAAAWTDDYRAWLAPRLVDLNDALLTRPLDRRLAATPAPKPDGSPAPDPIDESLKERLRTLAADCTARTLTASDDPAWRTDMGERLKGVVTMPPAAASPGGARYPDEAAAVAIFLPAPPADAEWDALARAASIDADALSPLRTAWEAAWTAGARPIAERAKDEVDLVQAMAQDAAGQSPRELALRVRSALEAAIRDVQQLESTADDLLYAGLDDRATPGLIAWWRSMRAAPPRASDAPGAGLGRAFGMGACRRDRSLVELAALTVATPQQRDRVLGTLAESAADRMALARELDRARLAAWTSVFEALVVAQRDPASLNPTQPRAALGSSADMSGRFVAMQDALFAACAESVPGIETALRERIRALAWPEFFAPRAGDPIDQRRIIEARTMLPTTFDAAALDATIERELVRIDAQSGRTPWLPGMPMADPEGDWPAILRRDPALFAAAWGRTVTTDRAVRDAALDPAQQNRAALKEWLQRAARPAGR